MSDVPQIATQAITTAPVAADAVSQALMWLVGIAVGGIAIARPVLDFVRRNRDQDGEEKVYVAKNSAEAFLYTHLSEQIKEQSARAAEASASNVSLANRVAHLEAQLTMMTDQAQTIIHLEERLNTKDIEMTKQLREAAEERREFIAILKSKDQEIISRDLRIAALDRRQLELEVRLSRDGQAMVHAASSSTTFCPECAHCQNNAQEILSIVSIEQAALAESLTTREE